MWLIDAYALMVYANNSTIGIDANDIARFPRVDAVPVVRCKDCVHAPIQIGQYNHGKDLDFPDEVCPFQCEDWWYNCAPDPNFYCADGERKDDE